MLRAFHRYDLSSAAVIWLISCALLSLILISEKVSALYYSLILLVCVLVTAPVLLLGIVSAKLLLKNTQLTLAKVYATVLAILIIAYFILDLLLFTSGLSYAEPLVSKRLVRSLLVSSVITLCLLLHMKLHYRRFALR